VNRVVLVEDDQLLRRALRASFRNWDFEVVEAGSGEEGLTMVANHRPDLVVLDLGLPGIDGLTTLRTLRAFSAVPVLVLTVNGELRDKIAAFEAGADDYVTKPFEPQELRVRVRAQLRRTAAPRRPVVFRSGALAIDLGQRLVTWDGEPVALTPTEFRLLEVLLGNRGKLLTREELLKAVWRSDFRSDRGNLRVMIGHLRRKLHDDAAHPRLVFTEPGLGYRWIAEDEVVDDEP